MNKYCVSLPIIGYTSFEVNADSEEEAIELALDSDIEYTEIVELETCRKIVKGNVFYGNLNEPDVLLIAENIEDSGE